MRLEILVDNEEPLIFPMNKPKVMIGSNEICDIVVNTSGVSRKHLAVVNEGDNYYVIDQGSTNGSYINEERLVPGRKVEFTSFFPVRMGDNVLMTLLSDEDAEEVSNLTIPVKETVEVPPPPSQVSRTEHTTMISLKNLKSASTQELVKKRTEGMARRRTEAKKAPVKKASGDTSMRNVKIVAFLVLSAAVYYNFFVVERIPAPDLTPRVPENKVGQVIENKIPEKKEAVVETPKAIAFNPDDIIPKDKIKKFSNELKCLSDIEKALCEYTPTAKEFPYGVVQVGSSLVLLLDKTAYEGEAKEIIEKTPTTYVTDPEGKAWPVRPRRDAEDFVLQTVALHRAVPKEFKFEEVKDLKVFVALYDSTKQNIYSVGAYTGENFAKASGLLTEDNLIKAKTEGKAAFSDLVQGLMLVY